ncbi:hypothetical protein FRC07_012199 [Ceratobasidium sp. 392]|nr:hypothetical protein FRC07_012199 [Ceratobasidium sp. 392]
MATIVPGLKNPNFDAKSGDEVGANADMAAGVDMDDTSLSEKDTVLASGMEGYGDGGGMKEAKDPGHTAGKRVTSVQTRGGACDPLLLLRSP